MYNKNNNSKPPHHPRSEPEFEAELSMKSINELFATCGDFETRDIDFGLDGNILLHVCWLDGIVSGDNIADNVLRPLTQLARAKAVKNEKECMERIMLGGVYSYSAKKHASLDEVISDLTHGHCAILIDGAPEALTFEVRSTATRSISEPILDKSIKGSKDSFVETLRVNTSLIRRRICSPKLKVIESIVGRKSNTRVSIMFVDGVAAPEKVEELARRLDALDVDVLLSTGTLEEYIVDAPCSLFPQIIHTEKPDRFAMHLADGRIGLLVDGLSIGMIIPASFSEFMKVSADASMHHVVATAATFLRYLSLVLGLLLPSVYVAIAMYHQEMIPTKLLLSIIEAKKNVPFSTALEVVAMILAFGLVQEAGLRLPNPVGDMASVIGALIVGQSVVEAKIISPAAIIVVALSAIAYFTLPNQDLSMAIRLTRFAMVAAAIAAGLFGIGLVACLMLLHLADIDSFGVNYTAPISDGRSMGLSRLLIRIPKPHNKFRDPALRTPDKRRQK